MICSHFYGFMINSLGIEDCFINVAILNFTKYIKIKIKDFPQFSNAAVLDVVKLMLHETVEFKADTVI